ncbi:MAG: InlB B-repeat-containing protein [Eubacteriaceae bacterium]|nr:InlB B-repeat-containing protein [Eubacteriaceae bacterium]
MLKKIKMAVATVCCLTMVAAVAPALNAVYAGDVNSEKTQEQTTVSEQPEQNVIENDLQKESDEVVENDSQNESEGTIENDSQEASETVASEPAKKMRAATKDADTVVDIPDAVFKAYLNKMLSQEAAADITETQMEKITKIDIPSGITDLEGVQYCKNLDWFRMWYKGAAPQNYAKLGQCTALTGVSFAGASMTDISFISSLTNLTYLNFWDNNISDISALKNLTKLQTLDLCHNNISDMSALAGYVDAMTSYNHLHDQTINITKDCTNGTGQCTVENPIIGIYGDEVAPNDVAGAAYDKATNTFIVDEGKDSFTFTFSQSTKNGNTADFENYYAGKVTVNVNHPAAEKVVVSYVPNGGKYSFVIDENGIDPSKVTVEKGTTVTATSNENDILFTREGYAFKEWNTAADGSGTTYKPGDTFIAENDSTLYAQWTKEEIAEPEVTACTVTFDTKGGSAVEEQKIKKGDTATEPTAPTKEGYTFKGWLDADGNKYDFNKAVNSDITLYAQWAKDQVVTPEGTDKHVTATKTATGPVNTARTGDQSDMMLWILLALLGMAGTTAAVISRKRTDSEK